MFKVDELLDFSDDEYQKFEEKLTDRECEVLKLKRRGWTDYDIAEELYLSRRTIQRTLRKIEYKIIKNI